MASSPVYIGVSFHHSRPDRSDQNVQRYEKNLTTARAIRQLEQCLIAQSKRQLQAVAIFTISSTTNLFTKELQPSLPILPITNANEASKQSSPPHHKGLYHTGHTEVLMEHAKNLMLEYRKAHYTIAKHDRLILHPIHLAIYRQK